MKRPERSQSTHPAGRRIAGRAQDDHVDDPYLKRRKPHEPTLCPDCGASFHQGKWQWSAAAAEARNELCPACHRIKDGNPAGIVRLTGPFVAQHKTEILNLARHQEEMEKRDHPINRIMAIDEQADGIEITTTDIHLPRRIGEALHHAYQGDLGLRYDEDAYFVRVDWSRDATER